MNESKTIAAILSVATAVRRLEYNSNQKSREAVEKDFEYFHR
jgi:hypothetical protein